MKAIFITARTKSSRLPRKCLLNIMHDKRTIEFLVERLLGLHVPVFLCTSTSVEDDELAGVVARYGVKVFRGSEEDKLRRWLECARENNVDFFVTADGDDLFVEPTLIGMALEQYDKHKHGFIHCTTTPTGSFSWGIETDSLERIYNKNVKEGMNTEMGFCWFDDVHELDNVPEEYLRTDIRMTLDYPEDLEFFKAVAEKIGNQPLQTILLFLDSNKDIIKLNWFREDDWRSNQKTLVEKIK